jgi:hypothetical protein
VRVPVAPAALDGLEDVGVAATEGTERIAFAPRRRRAHRPQVEISGSSK